MASDLVQAHIEGQRRIREAAADSAGAVWGGLPGYDSQNVDEWLTKVLPLIAAAERKSVALTGAFLGRRLGRPPIGINAAELIAGIRAGTPPEEVYRRPFVTVWTALSAGTQWEQAVADGLARATSAAAMDVQLTSRATFGAVGDADPNIFGYRRVADGKACSFCLRVNGAYVKSASAFALHNHCGCSLEPLTSPHRLASTLPSGVAVHEHGELGSMLGSPDHDFTTLGDLTPGGPPGRAGPVRIPPSPQTYEQQIGRVAKGIPAEKPTQPFKDFDEVFDQAEATKQAYRELLDLGGGLQKRLGADAIVEDDLAVFVGKAAKATAAERAQVVIAPLKRRATAAGKLKRKSYGAEGLTDLNRASVIVKGVDDIPAAVGKLRTWVDENPGWSIHELDDGFSGSGERAYGYRDLSVALRSPEGHISELQFHVDSMWGAKFRGGGHDLYEEIRGFQELGRGLTAAEKARLATLERESRDLYEAAWREALGR